MKHAFRLALGTFGALALMWLAVTAYGLAALIPIPRIWWRENANAIVYGMQIVSLVPFAFVAALAAPTLFKKQTALWSFACFFLASAICLGSLPFESIDVLMAALRVSVELILIFVVGVPLLVFLLQRWHSPSAQDRELS